MTTVQTSSLSTTELTSVIQAFEHEGASVRASLRHLLQDKETIAAALLLSLSFLKDQTLDSRAANTDTTQNKMRREQVVIEELARVEPAKFNQNLIDFQVRCSIDGGAINVGVVVLQERKATEVCQLLNRLLLYKDFGLNRLCILRSAEFIEDTPEIQTYLPRLLSPEIGGSFVDLQVGAITTLLTILYVFRGRRKYLINVPHIVHYLEQENLLQRNPILRDLMVTVQI
jgi:hypothetical protein